MDVKSHYVQKLNSNEKAAWFSAMMLNDGLKVIHNIIDGFKTLEELGTPLSEKDAFKIPQCPRLQLQHSEIAEILIDTFKKSEFVCHEKNAIMCNFPPVIQSGGAYNLDINSGSDKNYFNDDVIILCFGIKYENSYSTIIRTIMITPTNNNNLKKNYKFLIRVQRFITVILRDGVKLGKVYEDTVNFVKVKRPDLLQHLTHNFGSVIDEKARESCLIKANSEEIAIESKIFNVRIGFHDVYDSTMIKKSPYTYSLWIGDDVKIEKGRCATHLNDTNYTSEFTIIRQTRKMQLQGNAIKVK